MADVSKSHPVFLGFCHDALDRLKDDHSLEANRLRVRIETLVTELESWIKLPEMPENKETVIAAVLDAYRQVLALETTGARRAK